MNIQKDLIALRLAEAALLAPKAGDRLVLDDDSLRAAIERRRPLSETQKQQLLDSPMTLRRFKRLAQQIQNAVAGWEGSQGLLLAAAGNDDLQSLSTEDGKWELHFMPGRQQEIRLVLKCLDDVLLAALLQQQREIQARDSGGNILCQGTLDDDGELDTRWPFDLPPREHFQLVGGRFVVGPV